MTSCDLNNLEHFSFFVTICQDKGFPFCNPIMVIRQNKNSPTPVTSINWFCCLRKFLLFCMIFHSIHIFQTAKVHFIGIDTMTLHLKSTICNRL